MSVLRRFLTTYGTPHVRSYALGFAFLLATTGLTVAIPTFVEHAVDAMAAHETGTATAFAWAIIGAGIAVMVVRTLSRIYFFNPGRVIEYRLRSDLFKHLMALPRSYYDRMRPGEIVSRGTNDTAGVRAFVGFGSLQLFNAGLTLVLTIGKMAFTDILLTLVCVLPLGLAALVLRRAIGELFKLMRHTQEELGRMSTQVLETYGGVPVLQSFNALPLAERRFEQRNDALLRVSRRVAVVQAWQLPVMDVVGNGCLVLLLLVGGQRVIDGTLSPGELAAFAGYIRIVAGGLTSLGWLVNALQRGWISLKRVYEVMDAPVPTQTVPGPAEGAPKAEPDAALEVRGLTFTYPTPPAQSAEAVPASASGGASSERPPALADVSLTLRPGETLGIFGATGSGKTTLLSLLARVYEPPPGTVFERGTDIRNLDLQAYRKRLAYVPQDAWLFSQTLRENVALADGPDHLDEARVQASLSAAALDEDLHALPEGLHTKVGERGITLSGGQRQRTALARAFYRPLETGESGKASKGRGLLLLDDVLSAVDHATEKRLIDSIYARGKGQGNAVVLVSHRVSALKDADRIVVLDHGRIIAEGTHAALMADTSGPYWRAWRLQQARDADEAATHA